MCGVICSVSTPSTSIVITREELRDNFCAHVVGALCAHFFRDVYLSMLHRGGRKICFCTDRNYILEFPLQIHVKGIRGRWRIQEGEYPGGWTLGSSGSFALWPGVNLEDWLGSVISAAAPPSAPPLSELEDGTIAPATAHEVYDDALQGHAGVQDTPDGTGGNRNPFLSAMAGGGRALTSTQVGSFVVVRGGSVGGRRERDEGYSHESWNSFHGQSFTFLQHRSVPRIWCQLDATTATATTTSRTLMETRLMHLRRPVVGTTS